MRPILTLLSVPAVIIAFVAAAGFSQDGAPTTVSRPDPVPPVQGMVFVPAGSFLMGSTAEDVLKSADVDEFPQREVWVDDFYIDIHEVTNVQYKVFLDSTTTEPPPRWINGNYGIGEDGFPVVSVSWDDAVAYAAFVGKRLPTEVEWEKAARGTDGRTYPWGESFDRALANNSDRPMPIMNFPGGVSPYGAYDMAGNVGEWVDGSYDAYPRGPGDVVPEGMPDRREIFRSDRRVYRGGSWNTFPKYLRCANRESTSPGKRWVYVGFRCAMDPPWRADRSR
ncbi:MAG TPA: formylglycine-generating enzyme family protein [Candidatus Krumholzibacteria bacterium]|nr:formylglycine-generating enzyme family protein [Candidatus Krumholzibacteria bacterium]